jgi:hypothetical protein
MLQPVAIVAETATAVLTDDAVVDGFACAFGGTAAAQCYSAICAALIDRCAPARLPRSGQIWRSALPTRAVTRFGRSSLSRIGES